MSRNKIEIVGERFGRLVVVSESKNGTSKHRKVIVVCDCGVQKEVYASNLLKSNTPTRSCGCLDAERKTTHGMSYHVAFKVWEGMMRRCYSEDHEAFQNYGGRGIAVCEEWHEPERFISCLIDNGWHKGLQVDRQDNDLGYSPDNCRVVTSAENNLNKRTNRKCIFNGEVLTVREASEKYGIKYTTLRYRLDRGVSPDDAIRIQVQNTTSRLEGRQ